LWGTGVPIRAHYLSTSVPDSSTASRQQLNRYNDQRAANPFQTGAILLLAQASRPRGTLSLGYSGRGRKLTTHLHSKASLYLHSPYAFMTWRLCYTLSNFWGIKRQFSEWNFNLYSYNSTCSLYFSFLWFQ